MDIKKIEKKSYPKVEFLSVKVEVIDLKEKGYSSVGIYRQLHSAGRVTMSYSSFIRYLKIYGVASPAPRSTPKPTPAPAPALPCKLNESEQAPVPALPQARLGTIEDVPVHDPQIKDFTTLT